MRIDSGLRVIHPVSRSTGITNADNTSRDLKPTEKSTVGDPLRMLRRVTYRAALLVWLVTSATSSKARRSRVI
jgi:hypothetical protein